MNKDFDSLPVFYLNYFHKVMSDIWRLTGSKDALLNMIIITRKLTNNAIH